MVGADQHRIARGVGNEKNAAQYKRLQEYLPERGIRLHQCRKSERSISSSVLASRALARIRVPRPESGSRRQ